MCTIFQKFQPHLLLLQCPQDLYLLRPASLQTPHPPVKIIYNMLIIKNKRYMKHFCSSVIYVNSTNQQRNLLPFSSHRENSKMNKIRFQSPPLPWQKEQISFFLLETFLLAAAHSPFPDTKSDIQELWMKPRNALLLKIAEILRSCAGTSLPLKSNSRDEKVTSTPHSLLHFCENKGLLN